jgi:hypothetical protein
MLGGMTVGIQAAGKLLRPRGQQVSMVPTFLGTLTGVGVGALIGLPFDEPAVLFGSIVGGGLIGGIVGHELSEPQAAAGLQVVPVLGATRAGGLVAGLMGWF